MLDALPDLTIIGEMDLPPLLFRADSDSRNERKIHGRWNSGWLQTNLGSGGSPAQIYREPLEALIERHARQTWSKTHFLSFTASRVVAEHFAKGRRGGRLIPLDENANPWDTAIFTMDTKLIDVLEQMGPGILRCQFKHRTSPRRTDPLTAVALALQDKGLPDKPVEILLIHTETALEGIPERSPAIQDAIEVARAEEEWLVLPWDPFEDRGERTALLDDSCISRREKFRIESD